jgi:Kef-type K+ transport system membrane component KefB
MSRAGYLITGSAVVAVVIAVLWFQAPVVPAVLGALGAGLVLYWRQRRSGSADGP